MKKTIFALGFFDGVHIGHAALLHDCRALAEAHKAAAGVATFGAHPDALVFGKAPSLISSPEDRQWLLVNRFGMDTVLTLPFDEQMMHMPWRAFLDMMRMDYGGAGFVCGEDFRFGFRGQGTALTLSDYCREAGLPWAVVPEKTLDGERVSSTRIRQKWPALQGFWAIPISSGGRWSMAGGWGTSWAFPRQTLPGSLTFCGPRRGCMCAGPRWGRTCSPR